MGEGMVPVLCGGIYFTLILQAVKQQSDDCKHSDSDMFVGLIKVIDPNFAKPQGDSFRVLTSQYKSCSEKQPKISDNLPFTKSITMQSFNNRIQNEYKTSLKAMQGFTNGFIDVDSRIKVIGIVKALLELIQLDQSIRDTDIFYMKPDGHPISKSELIGLYDDSLPALNLCLPAFLLGIWHFIIIYRKDNSIGRATYDSWHKEAELSGQKREYVGEVGKNVKRRIEFIDIGQDAEDSDSVIATVLPGKDLLAHKITNFNNEIDTKAVGTPHNKTPSGQMKKIFKEAFERCHIEDVISRDPELINLGKLFFNEDLPSSVVRFVKTIQTNIISPFASYQNEMMYINILRFTNTVNEYNDYLLKTPPLPLSLFELIERPRIIDLFGKKQEQDSEFKKETDYYRQQIKSLYIEICGDDT